MSQEYTSTKQQETMPHLDATLNKFSQAGTFILSGLAFLLQWQWLVLIVGVILLISALAPAYSPYRLFYNAVLVKLGWLKPRIVEDDPAPHRFAQGIGTVFVLASALVLLLTQLTVLGWVLDLIVFVLSGLNYSIGFCAGCFVYYHLGRWGLLPRVRYAGGFHWRGV